MAAGLGEVLQRCSRTWAGLGRSHLLLPWLSPALTATFYFLPIPSQTVFLDESSFLLAHAHLKRLRNNQCRSFIKLWGLHIAKESSRERRKEGKQVGSSLTPETSTPLTTKLAGTTVLPLLILESKALFLSHILSRFLSLFLMLAETSIFSQSPLL